MFHDSTGEMNQCTKKVEYTLNYIAKQKVKWIQQNVVKKHQCGKGKTKSNTI